MYECVERVPSVEDDGGTSVCVWVFAWMCVLCVCAWLSGHEKGKMKISQKE